jgi:hypothetical protein
MRARKAGVGHLLRRYFERCWRPILGLCTHSHAQSWPEGLLVGNGPVYGIVNCRGSTVCVSPLQLAPTRPGPTTSTIRSPRTTLNAAPHV